MSLVVNPVMNRQLKQQVGQSIAETLVVMLAILLFFTAIPWLGRLFDIQLNQTNAGSYAAFQYTRQLDGINETDLKERFFMGADKNWRDRQHNLLLNPEQITINLTRQQKLSADMQAGMQAEYAPNLRREWQIEDQGIVQAKLEVRPLYSQTKSAETTALGLNLGFFDRLEPRLQSHTAILSDAAHSSSDLTSHQRTEWSDTAWRDAGNSSYELGRKIQSFAGPVDQGFNRPKPVFDWLQPWAGKLPGHHTQAKPFVDEASKSW